jgi:uncharacterized protein
MNRLFKKNLISMIKLYQYTFSFDHGLIGVLFPLRVCRYQPTCSQYAIDAIKFFGWRGLLMAARRLGRCHPFVTGGYDPVSPKSLN